MGKFGLWDGKKDIFIRFFKSCVVFALIFVFIILYFANKTANKNISTGNVTAVSDAVIRQNEFEGSNTSEGISVSAITPDLAGMELAEAKKLAEQNRLQVGEVKEEYSDTVKKGEVIRQNPLMNTKKQVGDTVNIVMSKGVEYISIPKLTGISISKAKEILEKSSLKYKVTEKYSSVKKGNVIKQSIKTGKKVRKGTVITLSVSKGKKIAGKPKTGYSAVTQKPAATRKPAATKTPVATKKPAVTKKPSSGKPKPADDDDFDISGW